MYIRVSEAGKRGIRLWLPLSLLKSRLVASLLRRAVDDDCDERKEDNADVSDLPVCSDVVSQCEDAADGKPSDGVPKLPTRKQLAALYRALRNAVKSCGHFDLVRVKSSDGDFVRIRI